MLLRTVDRPVLTRRPDRGPGRASAHEHRTAVWSNGVIHL